MGQNEGIFQRGGMFHEYQLIINGDLGNYARRTDHVSARGPGQMNLMRASKVGGGATPGNHAEIKACIRADQTGPAPIVTAEISAEDRL